MEIENKTEILQRSEKAWKKSYDAYLTKREKYLASGIAVKKPMSMDAFKIMYSQNYYKYPKSIIRAVTDSSVLLSGKQSIALKRGFKGDKIANWIEQQNKLAAAERDEEAKFMSDPENEGKEFLRKQIEITPEVAELLLSLKDYTAKGIRSPEFDAIYRQLYKPYIKRYNQAQKGNNFFTDLDISPDDKK